MTAKQPLDEMVDAILMRDTGIPYGEVLQAKGMTPRKFYRGFRELEGLLAHSNYSELIPLSEEGSERMAAIFSSEERKRELFRMEPAYLHQQYEDIIAGRLKHSGDGTMQHPDNIKEIIYYALTRDNKGLASHKREEVIAAIHELTPDLKEYFIQHKLGGLMITGFDEGERQSPLAVMRLFDKAYQEKTGDEHSLFDLSQKSHVHPWDIGGCAARFYWQDKENVEIAIYHRLAEENTLLASYDREQVVEGIKRLPADLQRYITKIGLSGLMQHGAGVEDSLLEVIKAFDRAYQQRTGDRHSLFDLAQKTHVHEWDVGGIVSPTYWKKKENRETATYHILTENYPDLASENRATVMETISSFPGDLRNHFRNIGLRKVMAYSHKIGETDSPLAVMRIFDKVYQDKTGNPSLFDTAQERYISTNGKKMIVVVNSS